MPFSQRRHPVWPEETDASIWSTRSILSFQNTCLRLFPSYRLSFQLHSKKPHLLKSRKHLYTVLFKLWASLCNREFKKLRQLMQRKLYIKIENCVRLSVLRLIHVCHVVQTRRSVFFLAWHYWFSYKGKNEKFSAAGLRRGRNLIYI